MVVERFSQNLINTGIFKIYTAIGFFATLIFFILNIELFTPVEMIFGAVFITVALKGFSNIMLSLIVYNVSLEEERAVFDSKYNDERLNKLVPKGIEIADDKTDIETENKIEDNKE